LINNYHERLPSFKLRQQQNIAVMLSLTELPSLPSLTAYEPQPQAYVAKGQASSVYSKQGPSNALALPGHLCVSTALLFKRILLYQPMVTGLIYSSHTMPLENSAKV
jgi:hypothetical protein